MRNFNIKYNLTKIYSNSELLKSNSKNNKSISTQFGKNKTIKQIDKAILDLL